ncbi:MAG TPA: heme peroxidase family protein [Terriglobales bacterium]|nr:heme peroxidase family protein [Terriglobales bacterium]
MPIKNAAETANSTSHTRLTQWARPEGGHGSLRGADSPTTSSQFEGLFGRMFRTLPAATFREEDLRALAKAMTADPEVVQDANGKDKRDQEDHLIPKATPDTELDDEENLGIPAGYTYLGQFIDHDITFDPASSLQKQNDPEALVDFRTPRLDLDCVYGRGPADQPYMFEPDGLRFRLGTDLTRNGKGTNAKDLPRINHRAIIGDKRNDENVIVSQLQGVFLQFHNAVADKLKDQSAAFEDIQRLVRWHYQWVVVHDFLPKIVGPDALHQVLPHLKNNTSIYTDKPQLNFFKWKNDPFMPIEFAAAAYRFGHSMVRPIYRLNKELDSLATDDQKARGVGGRQFIFGALRNESLNGFRDFPAQWAIDWRLFFEFDRKLDDPKNLGSGRVQPAYKIDTSLVNPLAFLPEFSEATKGEDGNFEMDADGHPKTKKHEIALLALRNLLRGMRMGLPSGQTVARYMDIPVIPDKELKVGKANVDGLKDNQSIVDLGSSFRDNAPLWFYVLAESLHEWSKAAESKKGDDTAKNSIPVKLGPIGGRIVTEVLVGLVLRDSFSFLHQWPGWTPFLKGRPDFAPFAPGLHGRFGIAELITAAGLG